jgi:hypothetical protein
MILLWDSRGYAGYGLSKVWVKRGSTVLSFPCGDWG